MKNDYEKIITDLTFHNFKLKEELREYKENMKCIGNRFYCIGGFCNDYQGKLTKKIRRDLNSIRQYIIEEGDYARD